MKDPTERTKIVIRHLPPAISQAALMELVDAKFAGRYDWSCFRPGKHSQKHQRYSRAYINFKMPGDVVEFAEIFNGHMFVNEKGTQFKAIVEYAPSQRVPKPWSKKDGREGTILKDPDYLEFLELISKPTEHLPSAEIQLERKEAERAGTAKEAIIVTPLMEFVRQKRSTKNGSQKLATGKHRPGLSSSSSTRSSRKGFDRRRGVSTPMYVLRDATKSPNAIEKTPYILMSKRDEQHNLADKAISVTSGSGKEPLEEEFGYGKSRIVLLKGKEKDMSDVPGGLGQKHIVLSSDRRSSGAKQSPNIEVTGKIIRSILTKGGRASQSSTSESQREQQPTQVLNAEKEKRPPRPPARSIFKDHVSSGSSAAVSDGDDKRYLDEKVSLNNNHVSVTVIEKHDRRSKNKDKPDRGVWAPLRRSEKSNYGDNSHSPSLEPAPTFPDSLEHTISTQIAGRREDTHSQVGGRISLSSVENGSHRHAGRRGAPRSSKDADSLNISEFKTSKRTSGGYGSHERQVWVQKSGPAA